MAEHLGRHRRAARREQSSCPWRSRLLVPASCPANAAWEMLHTFDSLNRALLFFHLSDSLPVPTLLFLSYSLSLSLQVALFPTSSTIPLHIHLSLPPTLLGTCLLRVQTQGSPSPTFKELREYRGRNNCQHHFEAYLREFIL